jgi:hypothetical protein
MTSKFLPRGSYIPTVGQNIGSPNAAANAPKPITSGDLEANITGSSALATGVTFSNYLDFVLSSVQGTIIYRNVTGWTTLPPGTSGFILESLGPTNNIQWSALTPAMIPLIATHILVGNVSGQAADVAVSGDGTLSSSGALIVTKTNGAPFVASAIVDTTNAANITSGALPSSRLVGNYSGITGIGTISSGTWQSTVIGVQFGGTGASLAGTGGANRFLCQASAGASITVRAPAFSDLTGTIATSQYTVSTGSISAPTGTNVILFNIPQGAITSVRAEWGNGQASACIVFRDSQGGSGAVILCQGAETVFAGTFSIDGSFNLLFKQTFGSTELVSWTARNIG